MGDVQIVRVYGAGVGVGIWWGLAWVDDGTGVTGLMGGGGGKKRFNVRE